MRSMQDGTLRGRIARGSAGRRFFGPAISGLAIAALTACGGHLESEPGVFDARQEVVELPHGSLEFTYVKPETPRKPVYLVVFATGDAGWMGSSGAIFDHLAHSGYYLAGYNSREGVKQIEEAERTMPITDAAIDLARIISHAKKALHLSNRTPTILAGASRGASMVILGAAVRKLHHRLAGAVALSLTKEADYMRTPEGVELPEGVMLDEEGRILTYPLMDRLGSLPVAVIQADGDAYVPASEARDYMGPDTATRRLYTVENTNHGFSGARDVMLSDLDDALAWVTASRHGSRPRHRP